MQAKRKIGIWLTLAIAFFAAASEAFGQDFPTFKGDFTRQGRTSNPAGSMPAGTVLQWFHPNDMDGRPAGITIDNTDPAAAFTAGWTIPTPDQEATSPFLPTPASAPYRFVTTIESYYKLDVSTGLFVYDPTRAQNLTDTLEVATYTFQPADSTPRSYALFIWIPSGPTTIAGTQFFPVTHFNYEIDFGVNQKQVGIFDITQGTGDWARFGKTATLTNPLFAYDGVHPIVIKLFNTVARDPNTGSFLDDFNSPTHPGATTMVYADAFQASPPLGSITASPTVHLLAGGTDSRVVTAVNLSGQVISDGSTTNVTKGVVNSYVSNDANGTLKWSWSPGGGSLGGILDDTNPLVTSQFPFAPSPPPALNGIFGSTYQLSSVLVSVNTDPNYAAVSYEPAFPDGNYDIYVWLAGNNSGLKFGTHVQYEVDEGDPLTTGVSTLMALDQRNGVLPSFVTDWNIATTYAVNDLAWGTDGALYKSLQGANTGHSPVPPDGVWWAAATNSTSGWVKLGSRSFRHADAAGKDLTVKITNLDALNTDPAAGSYADAVWFVNASANTEVTSTPIQAVVGITQMGGGAPVDTEVTVVCAEDGKIYCLDSTGNGDGTTKVYWTYPSTLNFNVWDPATTYASGSVVFGSNHQLFQSLQNNNTGHDPVNPANAAWWGVAPDPDPNHVAGLDGPGGLATMPATFGMSSPLVLRAVSVGGTNKDVLYVASSNGRVYAIDMAGRGDWTASVPGTTKRIWTWPNDYPSANPQISNLGAFVSSVAASTTTAAGPTIFVPGVYGTGINQQGRMFALDAAGNADLTANIRWQYPDPTSIIGGVTTTPAVAFGNVYFGTSMLLGGTQPGTLFSLNQDTGAVIWNVSSFNDSGNTVPMDNFLGGPATVASGEFQVAGMPNTVFASNENKHIFAFDATTGAQIWQTGEIQSGVQGALTFTPLPVTDNSGNPGNFDTVMVPTEDGKVVALFANSANLNRKGTRRAWEYDTAGSIAASIAVGLNWFYCADLTGYIYAFSSGPGVSAGAGAAPGSTVTTENTVDPMRDLFNGMLIKFVSRTDYINLRKGTMTYAALIAATSPPNAYEFGQTVYAVLYNYPFVTANVPVANFAFSANGVALRSGVHSRSQLFPDRMDFVAGDNVGGYALISYTTLVNGTNSLVPGTVTITPTLTTTNGTYDRDASLPAITFGLANPFALVFPVTSPTQSIGNTVDPTNPEAQENGSGDVAGGHQSQFTTTIGTVSHAQTGAVTMGVVDRSLYTLIRGPNQGLDSVRVERSDLAWNRNFAVGTSPVFKQLPPFTSATPSKVMEDLPLNVPNSSLDYPDIRKSAIRVTKDPSGSAENPLYSGVKLAAPSPIAPADLTITPLLRTLNPTPFLYQVDVPRFQPTNTASVQDENTQPQDGGYSGILTVYADNNLPSFDITAVKRTAYRTLVLSGSVAVDERLSIGTPIVDLGSVPTGAGYTPSAPGGPPSPFSPYTGPYAPLFQTFMVRNEGNVNLIDLRLAHGTQVMGLGGSQVQSPWQIMAPSGDLLSWLDSGTGSSHNLWSDMDFTFYNAYEPNVVLQKPRVGDLSPSQLSMNPHVRANANLGVSDGYLLPTGVGVFPPIGNPRVGVSLPLGFPSGTYSSLLRVIEDDWTNPENQLLDLADNYVPRESMTDPSFTLKFASTESRLTNTYSPTTAPFADDLLTAGSNPSFLYRNVQPTGARDLNGNLVVAWASDRRDASNNPTWLPPALTGPLLDPSLHIYVASVQGATPATLTDSNSPLNDLGGFVPDTSTGTPPTRWMKQFTPIPSEVPETLFGFPANTIIPSTLQFHYPSLPTSGFVDPLTANPLTLVTMAFTGEAQANLGAGRAGKSMLFATTLTTDATGAVGIGATKAMTSDATSLKGRPSVIEYTIGGGATPSTVIFYESAGTGQSVINWVSFDPTNLFSEPTQLSMPNGFESVGTPSANIRPYVGTGGLGPNPVIDLLFTGKLRGRSSSEVFFGRMLTDAAGHPHQLAFLPAKSGERLTREAEPGLYRSTGVGWNLQAPVQLHYKLPSAGVATPLLATAAPGLPTVDPSTGLIVADTPLGRVYLDPGLGTVRFATAPPNPQAEVTLDYQAEFTRVSTATSTGFRDPSLAFDNRLVNEVLSLTQDAGNSYPPLPSSISPLSGFWGKGSNTPAAPADQVRAGRYIATYGGAATGAGHGARPYMKTMRLGVSLGHPVYVNANGLTLLPDNSTPSITVTGAVSFWQVDPTQGKIYFTPQDEDQPVTINFSSADDAGNISAYTVSATVGLIEERGEAAMPIELATNESNVSTFIDPFDRQAPLSGWQLPGYHPAPGARPDLFWVFWSSTRRSGSDIFFQTLAPRFTPVLSGK